MLNAMLWIAQAGTPAASHRFGFGAFFLAPALCRCAHTIVESIMAYSLSDSLASVSKMRCQTLRLRRACLSRERLLDVCCMGCRQGTRSPQGVAPNSNE
jgi:hypothetical protein